MLLLRLVVGLSLVLSAAASPVDWKYQHVILATNDSAGASVVLEAVVQLTTTVMSRGDHEARLWAMQGSRTLTMELTRESGFLISGCKMVGVPLLQEEGVALMLGPAQWWQLRQLFEFIDD